MSWSLPSRVALFGKIIHIVKHPILYSGWAGDIHGKFKWWRFHFRQPFRSGTSLKTVSFHHFMGGGRVMVAWCERGSLVVGPNISVESPNISVERPNIIVVQHHPKIGKITYESTKNTNINFMNNPTAVHVRKCWSEKKIKDLDRSHGPGSWVPRCCPKA